MIWPLSLTFLDRIATPSICRLFSLANNNLFLFFSTIRWPLSLMFSDGDIITSVARPFSLADIHLLIYFLYISWIPSLTFSDYNGIPSICRSLPFANSDLFIQLLSIPLPLWRRRPPDDNFIIISFTYFAWSLLLEAVINIPMMRNDLLENRRSAYRFFFVLRTVALNGFTPTVCSPW